MKKKTTLKLKLFNSEFLIITNFSSSKKKLITNETKRNETI